MRTAPRPISERGAAIDTAVADAIRLVCGRAHEAAVKAGWWNDLHSGKDLRTAPGETPLRNVPELLCLIHSEISEALEGFRCDAMDDHLPDRPAIEVELADAILRICDLTEGLGLDLGGAVAAKIAYNASRADHSRAARLAAGGKRF